MSVSVTDNEIQNHSWKSRRWSMESFWAQPLNYWNVLSDVFRGFLGISLPAKQMILEKL